MHYLLVISSLSAGGAERVLSGLANRWVNQGHRVSIIPFKNIQPFYTLDERVECVWLPESPISWLKPLFFLAKLLMFRYHVHRLQPDRVLSFLDKTNLATLFMLWRQGYYIAVSERIDPRRYYIHPIWRWLRHKLYPTANCVVVQTPSIASYFPYTTTVIPNPVTPAPQQVEIQPKATRLITVGRLDPQKDHITLVRAVGHLVKNHPNLQLFIYGDGVEHKRLKEAMHNMHLEAHVKLMGLTTDVSVALCQSDIFVFPSLYEGFPNALCEAMAHGLPVVASDVPGNNDVVENGVNGYLFPVGQDQALATVLESLIDDCAARASCSFSAVQSMEKYSPDLIGSIWDSVMK